MRLQAQRGHQRLLAGLRGAQLGQCRAQGGRVGEHHVLQSRACHMGCQHLDVQDTGEDQFS